MSESPARAWTLRRTIAPARLETAAGVLEVQVHGAVVEGSRRMGSGPERARFLLYRMRPTRVVVERADGRREEATVPDVCGQIEQRMLVMGGVVALLALLLERTLRS